MGRVTSEATGAEGVQPDQDPQPNVDAGPALKDTAKSGAEHQKRGYGLRGRDLPGYDPRVGDGEEKIVPVDFTTAISRAGSEGNSVEASTQVFKTIADLVRACSNPNDCEALAQGLDKASEHLARAVLKGTPSENLTGVVGKV